MLLGEYITGNGTSHIRYQEKKLILKRIKIISGLDSTPTRGLEIATKTGMTPREVAGVLGDAYTKTRALNRQLVDTPRKDRHVLWSIRTGHEAEVREGIGMGREALHGA